MASNEVNINNDSADSCESNEHSFVFIRQENPLPPILQQFRLDKQYIDVHLKIGDKQSPAHRLVLACCSPMLAAMLSHKFDPERKSVCELMIGSQDEQLKQFAESEIVDDLLTFFYTGEVTITTDNARLLLVAADYLLIEDLKNAADQFITSKLQLSLADVLDEYRFADMYRLDFLRDACLAFIEDNYKTFFVEGILLAISEQLLEQLFKDLTKSWSNMILNEAMFELLFRWIKHEPTTRLKSLITLLTAIPLEEVSEHFRRNVIKEEIIQLCNDSQDSQEEETPETPAPYDLYFIGGFANSLFGWAYHLNVSTKEYSVLNSGQWTEMSSMVYPRRSFSSARVGNRIYCFGGTWFEADNVHSAVCRSSNTVQVLDVKTNRWTILQAMPTALEGSAAVEYDGYIYVSGGNQEDGSLVPDVHRYCIATNKWDSVAPMVEPRMGHKMVVLKDHIYALGGYWPALRTIEEYDPETNEWKIVVNDADLIGLHDATAHQDKIYIFERNEIRVYDPQEDTIETIQRIANRQDLWNTSVASIDDKIVVVDSRDDFWGGLSNDLHIYEYIPVAHEWKKLGVYYSKDSQAVIIKR